MLIFLAVFLVFYHNQYQILSLKFQKCILYTKNLQGIRGLTIKILKSVVTIGTRYYNYKRNTRE